MLNELQDIRKKESYTKTRKLITLSRQICHKIKVIFEFTAEL